MLSIVIPIHNEERSILPLYDRLTSVMFGLARPYEILFIDDASTDRSHELLANLVQTDPRLKVVRLRRNFGQTAALSAGFHEAKGNGAKRLCAESRRYGASGNKCAKCLAHRKVAWFQLRRRR